MRSFMIKFNQYSSDNRIFNLINFYIILLVCGVSGLCCCKEEDQFEKLDERYLYQWWCVGDFGESKIFLKFFILLLHFYIIIL